MKPWSADHPPGGDARPRPITEMSGSRFGRATGFNLKLRFLLALTLLSLAPAFVLVLLYQQANDTSLNQAGQQALAAAAQTNSKTLTTELTSRQAYLARLAQQDSIAQASRGAGNSQQADDLLNSAQLSTKDAIAWMVLNGSDQIVAAAPTSLENERLSSSTLLTHSSALENFVQTQRHALTSKEGQADVLPVARGLDSKLRDNVWIATLAFVSPGSPAHSGVVLAVFSLPGMVQTYLSALPGSPNSYVSVFDGSGAMLGVAGNQKLARHVGKPLAIVPLQHAVHALQTRQRNVPFTYHDPMTGTEETAAGFMNKDLGMVFLVVAPPGDLAPVPTGLLQVRNIPLIFLSIIVITTLVATWVALPIVHPIRRATREILASTEDVRVLAEQARQIAKDQRLGADILEGAAKGLDMRRRAIGRDASLIVHSACTAAARLAQMAHAISALPESAQFPLQRLTREVYQELETSHQLASGISSGLANDPAQKRLGNVMEGAKEISQQFDHASQQLQHGAARLKRAAETLQ